MKTAKTSLLLIVVALIIDSCARPRYYISPDFNSKTTNHKTVAILPVEMIFSGKKPEKLTDADIKNIEEGESLAFQMSLYNSILRNSVSKRRGVVSVTFQPYEKTRAILQNANIGIRDSWNIDPQKLAQLLQVDAVVKTRVQKYRYMSDLASYGMNVATNIAFDVLGPLAGGVLMVAGPGMKTNDIDAQCSLHNGNDGSLLWKDMYNVSADWARPANFIVENLTDNFGRNFPYRKK